MNPCGSASDSGNQSETFAIDSENMDWIGDPHSADTPLHNTNNMLSSDSGTASGETSTGYFQTYQVHSNHGPGVIAAPEAMGYAVNTDVPSSHNDNYMAVKRRGGRGRAKVGLYLGQQPAHDCNNNTLQSMYHHNSYNEELASRTSGSSDKDELNEAIDMRLPDRPANLQDAICKYINFLINENERRTHISVCQMDTSIPLGFESERYYREVISKPVPFPTPRFRDWLKVYNVDIEITDQNGDTVSETVFPPSVALAESSSREKSSSSTKRSKNYNNVKSDANFSTENSSESSPGDVIVVSQQKPPVNRRAYSMQSSDGEAGVYLDHPTVRFNGMVPMRYRGIQPLNCYGPLGNGYYGRVPMYDMARYNASSSYMSRSMYCPYPRNQTQPQMSQDNSRYMYMPYQYSRFMPNHIPGYSDIRPGFPQFAAPMDTSVYRGYMCRPPSESGYGRDCIAYDTCNQQFTSAAHFDPDDRTIHSQYRGDQNNFQVDESGFVACKKSPSCETYVGGPYCSSSASFNSEYRQSDNGRNHSAYAHHSNSYSFVNSLDYSPRESEQKCLSDPVDGSYTGSIRAADVSLSNCAGSISESSVAVLDEDVSGTERSRSIFGFDRRSNASSESSTISVGKAVTSDIESGGYSLLDKNNNELVPRYTVTCPTDNYEKDLSVWNLDMYSSKISGANCNEPFTVISDSSRAALDCDLKTPPPLNLSPSYNWESHTLNLVNRDVSSSETGHVSGCMISDTTSQYENKFQNILSLGDPLLLEPDSDFNSVIDPDAEGLSKTGDNVSRSQSYNSLDAPIAGQVSEANTGSLEGLGSCGNQIGIDMGNVTNENTSGCYGSESYKIKEISNNAVTVTTGPSCSNWSDDEDEISISNKLVDCIHSMNGFKNSDGANSAGSRPEKTNVLADQLQNMRKSSNSDGCANHASEELNSEVSIKRNERLNDKSVTSANKLYKDDERDCRSDDEEFEFDIRSNEDETIPEAKRSRLE